MVPLSLMMNGYDDGSIPLQSCQVLFVSEVQKQIGLNLCTRIAMANDSD